MEKQNIDNIIVWRDVYLKWFCGFANAFGGLSATFQRKTSVDSMEKTVVETVVKAVVETVGKTVVEIFNLRERHFFRRIGPNKGGRWDAVEHSKTGDIG